MNLKAVLVNSATLSVLAGVTVERYHGRSMVVFKAEGVEFCTLQGDEADDFNDECIRVYEMVSEESSEISMIVVELALAEPYLILLADKS